MDMLKNGSGSGFLVDFMRLLSKMCVIKVRVKRTALVDDVNEKKSTKL